MTMTTTIDALVEALQGLIYARDHGTGFDQRAAQQKACEALARARSEQAQSMVLVPSQMTNAMRDVVQQDDWDWAELLAAAEAVTEDEYCEILSHSDSSRAEQAEPVGWYDGNKFYASKESASMDCADMTKLAPVYRGITVRAEQAEPKVRYCPECGSIGEVPAKALDCCPDGGAARYVPERFATLCRESFMRALAAPPAAPAKLEPLTLREIAVLTEPWAHVRSDYSIGIARAVEAAHNAKLGGADGIKPPEQGGATGKVPPTGETT